MRWLRILWVKLLAGINRHRSRSFPGAGRSFDPARRRNGTGTQPPAETYPARRTLPAYKRRQCRLGGSFNAPLAGVIFALEELHRNFSVVVLLPAMAAAMTATVISRFFFGNDTIFDFFGLPFLPLEYYGYVALFKPGRRFGRRSF